MESEITPALQVRLSFDGQPTFGALRVFVNLSQDMPDSAALGLIRDATTDGISAVASEIW